LTSAARLLAAPEADKAGPLGLLVIIMLGVAVYFLYRSMVRHMNKVPASFDDTDPAEPATPADRQPPAGSQPTGSQPPTDRRPGPPSEP
jgi:hypothetical protein